MQQPSRQLVRFGSFEVDLEQRKLTKMGTRIRLQEQPFRILALLLERPGQLVTREEIRQKLWSHEVFVDFDTAVNTAVRKLREVLNDSADNPRFLETVHRQGYRFVAPVAWQPEPESVPAAPPTRRHSFLWLVASTLVIAVVGGFWHFRHPIPNDSRGYDHPRRFCQQHWR